MEGYVVSDNRYRTIYFGDAEIRKVNGVDRLIHMAIPCMHHQHIRIILIYLQTQFPGYHLQSEDQRK